MEPILLLGGLAALLYWITSGSKPAAGGGGGRAVSITNSVDASGKPVSAPVAVQTTDDYKQGAYAGRLDAGECMDAVVASGLETGPATGSRYEDGASDNWKAGYQDGYTNMLAENGWTYDVTANTITQPPMSTKAASDATADSATAYNDGMNDGALDAQHSMDGASTPPGMSMMVGSAVHPNYSAHSPAYAGKGLGSFYSDGYNHGFDQALYNHGFHGDASGIGATQVATY